MKRKKDTMFTFRRGVVFFLIFLNFFLIATPFVQAFNETNSIENTRGIPFQNGANHEDNLPLKNTTDEFSEYNFSVRKRQYSIENNKIHLNRNEGAKHSKDLIASTYKEGFPNLRRPDYYIFLSLYKLF